MILFNTNPFHVTHTQTCIIIIIIIINASLITFLPTNHPPVRKRKLQTANKPTTHPPKHLTKQASKQASKHRPHHIHFLVTNTKHPLKTEKKETKMFTLGNAHFTRSHSSHGGDANPHRHCIICQRKQMREERQSLRPRRAVMARHLFPGEVESGEVSDGDGTVVVTRTCSETGISGC